MPKTASQKLRGQDRRLVESGLQLLTRLAQHDDRVALLPPKSRRSRTPIIDPTDENLQDSYTRLQNRLVYLLSLQ